MPVKNIVLDATATKIDFGSVIDISYRIWSSNEIDCPRNTKSHGII